MVQSDYSLGYRELNDLIRRLYNSRGANASNESIASFALSLFDPFNAHEFHQNSIPVGGEPKYLEMLKNDIKRHSGLFFRIGIIKAIVLAGQFANPVFLAALTDSFSLGNFKTSAILSGSLVLVLIFSNLFSTRYTWMLAKLKLSILAHFHDLLYLKLLNSFENVQKTQNSDESGTNCSPIPELSNIITTDMGQILNFFISFHETWGDFVKLIIGTLMLLSQIGTSCLWGLASALVLVTVNFRVAHLNSRFYEKYQKHRDRRICMRKEFTLNMIAIKCLHWEKSFSQKCQRERNGEFWNVALMKYLDAFCVCAWSSAILIIAGVTFSVYQWQNGSLDGVNVFSVILLFNIVIYPLNNLGWTISGMLNARIAFRRFLKYFGRVERLKRNFEREERFTGTSSQSRDEIIMKTQGVNWIPTGTSEDQDESHGISRGLGPVDLSIPFGSRVLISGGVGSGKTLLLNTFLNEGGRMASPETLTCPKPAGYLPQRPWIQSASIQSNILFGSPKYEDKLEQVIGICQLQEDVFSFDEGIMKLCGSEGNKLSGGQRQRVALARALYQEAPVYFFDDPLSSVDPEVGDRIIHQVIGFVQRKSTLFVVSSRPLPFDLFDFEISIESRVGAQEEYTSKVSLIKRREYSVETNTLSYTEVSSSFNFPDSSHSASFESNSDFNRSRMRFSESATSNRMEESTLAQKTELKEKLTSGSFGEKSTEALEEVKEKDEEEEERKAGEIHRDTIFLWIQSQGVCYFLLTLFSLGVWQWTLNYFYIWLSDIDAFEEDPIHNKPPLVFIHQNFFWSILAVTGAAVFFTFIRALVFMLANLNGAKNLFNKLENMLNTATAEFYSKRTTGQIINRTARDTGSIDISLPFEFNIMYNCLANLIGSYCVIVLQTPLLLLLISFNLLPLHFYQKRYRFASRELKRLDSTNYSLVLSRISETETGIKTIRGLSREQQFFQEYLVALKALLCSSSILEGLSVWLAFRLTNLSILITAGSLGFFLVLLKSGYSESTQSFGLSLTYCLNITSMLSLLVSSVTSTEREVISVERINQYLQEKCEEGLEREPQRKIEESYEPPNGGKGSELEFRNVTFAYPETNIKALKEVNFRVAQGEKVAIIGRTGSGKSTLFGLLLRLFELQEGEVTLDGRNIKDLSLGQLRKGVSAVLQVGLLFEGTLRSNLDPFQAHPPEEIDGLLERVVSKMKAAKVNLAFEKFRAEFEIGTNGSNVSAGERQLINLIRVLLDPKGLVFLDEATSSIDSETSSVIFDLLFEAVDKKGASLVSITHSYENLGKFDKIFKMESGKLVGVKNKPEEIGKEVKGLLESEN